MLAIVLREIRAEFVSVMRQPMFALPTLLFPTMFYVFFALTFAPSRAIHMPTWLLATYGVFGVMAPALFGFGVGIAVERGAGWLRLKRVVPVPTLVPLLARTAMAMACAFMVFAILAALGATFGEVRMPRADWIALALVLTAGAVPFCALGLAIGVWLSPNAAPAVVNLVFLPMAFLSGLWVPVMMFPEWLQRIAPVLPPYHLAAIALDVAGAQSAASIPFHAAVLAAFTAVFLAVAAAGWRRIQEV